MWNDREISVPEDNSNSKLFAIERRSEARRILVHIPVEVAEIDGDGHHITERTYIEDVSDFGCRFSAHGPVQQGDTIALKIIGPQGDNLPDEEPRLYEIMWIARKAYGSTVGARLRQGEKPANIRFPLENDGEKHDPK